MGRQYVISTSGEKMEYSSEIIAISEKLAKEIGRFVANRQNGFFIYERNLLSEETKDKFLEKIREMVNNLFIEYQRIGKKNE